MNKSEQLIACLEGEIAKRDETIARLEPQLNRAIQANYDLREELAACRVAVENCEVFRARIVELEDDLKCAHSMLAEVSKAGMALRAELSAIKAQEPVTVEFMQFMTAVVTGAGLLSRGKQSKGLASELSATAYKYMLGAQVSGYQQKPIGYRCWFNKEPKNIMVEWGKSLPSDMNPSATYQELYAAPVVSGRNTMDAGVCVTDCRSCDGVAVGIIDAVITLARVFNGREVTPALEEALIDLRSDEDVISMISFTQVVSGQGVPVSEAKAKEEGK